MSFQNTNSVILVIPLRKFKESPVWYENVFRRDPDVVQSTI